MVWGVIAVRRAVKRSVVATRGSRRVEGMRQISWNSSGDEGVSKGEAIRLTWMERRFGSPEKASFKEGSSQNVPM